MWSCPAGILTNVLKNSLRVRQEEEMPQMSHWTNTGNTEYMVNDVDHRKPQINVF